MNFHKTIGFLATLLLTLGLGVPDSFAQTVSLSFNPSSMDEGDEVAVGKLVVSVTLDAAADAATTVTVTLAAATDGNTLNLAASESGPTDLGLGVGLALSLEPVPVVIAKGSMGDNEEISFTYAPPEDGTTDRLLKLLLQTKRMSFMVVMKGHPLNPVLVWMTMM